MRKAFWNFIFAFSIILVLTGCSSKIELSYEPSLKTEKYRNLFIHILPLNNDIDSVSIQDKPKGKQLQIGIIEFEDLSNWVSNALKVELQQSGYFISTIDQAFDYEVCYGAINFENQSIAIEFTVKMGSDIIFKKFYQSKQLLEIKLYRFLFGPKSAINKALNRSLQDICDQFITDLNQELIPIK